MTHDEYKEAYARIVETAPHDAELAQLNAAYREQTGREAPRIVGRIVVLGRDDKVQISTMMDFE